ncbi:MAG TPA: UDPGP type 1 family protein [Urbifossiella sp.]|jgi:UDP-N-acetylglucosamine/UDP-N-acetylgalactosamine diphosphorylase
MIHVPPELLHRLVAHRQEHLVHGWDSFDITQRTELVSQLAGIDFTELESLFLRKDEPHSVLPPREKIAPIPVADVAATSAERAIGEDSLRGGEAAALLVAGGQGSRLGFDKPKGMFPIGPISNASLFQIHAEKVLALSRRFGKPAPLLVMTSPATHDDTEAFFKEHRYFGLAEADVYFFQQGTMPALDLAAGKVLLEAPGKIFLSPNGHGGTLTALAETGLLPEIAARGVKHVFYFQVDNPLVKIGDPDFLGRHIAANSEASSKVVFKEKPEEKVGVLAVVDGKCGIIEYSDLPAALAEERSADGTLRFRAGSPAIHIFSVPFLERITSRDSGLAFHVARKKVEHFDPAAGAVVKPVRENALKFEKFVFDALPMADRWLAVATLRAEEFAPLKNAEGADTPAEVRRALSALHAGWLKQAGIDAGRHAVEVSPLFALDAAELREKLPADFSVNGPTWIK